MRRKYWQLINSTRRQVQELARHISSPSDRWKSLITADIAVGIVTFLISYCRKWKCMMMLLQRRQIHEGCDDCKDEDLHPLPFHTAYKRDGGIVRVYNLDPLRPGFALNTNPNPNTKCTKVEGKSAT